MIMPCEYHDPPHVAAISTAIAKSVAMQKAYAVWVLYDDNAGHALHAPLDEAPTTGFRWVINSYVCEEQLDGKRTRACTLEPVGFRCIWREA